MAESRSDRLHSAAIINNTAIDLAVSLCRLINNTTNINDIIMDITEVIK
jgi:hypothetical protein